MTCSRQPRESLLPYAYAAAFSHPTHFSFLLLFSCHLPLTFTATLRTLETIHESSATTFEANREMEIRQESPKDKLPVNDGPIIKSRSYEVRNVQRPYDDHDTSLKHNAHQSWSYEDMITQRLREVAFYRSIDVREANGTNTPSKRDRLMISFWLADKSEETKSSDSSTFMKLPAELRNRVYKMVLVYPDHCLILPKTPALLQVSQQIRKEAGDIFFHNNRIALPLTCHVPGAGFKEERPPRR